MFNNWNHLPFFKRQRYKGPKKPLPDYFPTIYKILMAALKNRICKHLLRNNILPEEQKDCHKMSRGCKDQLLVSKNGYIFREETSKASIYGMDWLQESIRQPTWHLYSHCHGEVPNISNNQTICGGISERMEDWNVALPHWRAWQNRKSGC